jgi:hypothetical protein
MFRYKARGGSMYFSKGEILYHYVWLSKRKGPLLAIKGGGSTIGFQMRSPLSKCIYLHCPPILKGGGTIALYFTVLKFRKNDIWNVLKIITKS